MPKARTVADVVLGEAAYGSPQQRYEDMKAIASVISNRARALGVTPEQVVSNRREFNAYGKALPSGVSAYRNMAQQAIEDVATNGPVHGATFYATPKAADNLPKGLKRETATSGHVYFSDPQNRAIGTALGFRQPRPAETAAQAISGILSAEAQPASPSERMGLLSAYSPPQEQPAEMAQTVPTRSVQTTSYFRPEPEVSLDTLQQQPAPAPAMSLQEQYASYGAGKQASQLAGLLGQDVAYQGLIDGLNAQKTQLAAGLNPMDEAAPWKTPTQPTPMVDVPDVPQVSPEQTASVASPASMGLIPQQAPRDVAADQALAEQVAKGLGRAKMAGGMGGGLLGGLMLGPLGALAGGLLGRTVGARTYYPPAPTPTNPNQNNSTNTGRGGLNDYGRSVNDSSRQFRDAIDNGGIGLY